MRILIVSATALEIKPLINELGKGRHLKQSIVRYKYRNYIVDVVITGVGMVPTAVFTSFALSNSSYDAVINAGICGSFNRQIPIGDVLNIHIDSLPETGAEDGEHFLSLIDLRLLDKDDFPFYNGRLHNESVFDSSLINELPVATGVTVNKVHGNSKSIDDFVLKYQADVESMEGAAFFYACQIYNVRCLQVRSVSNYIEERDMSKWDIPLSVNNLNRFLIQLLNE